MSFVSTAEIFYIDAVNQDDIYLYCKYMRKQPYHDFNFGTIWSPETFYHMRENEEYILYHLEKNNQIMSKEAEIISLINTFPIPLTYMTIIKNSLQDNIVLENGKYRNINHSRKDIFKLQEVSSKKSKTSFLLRDDVKSCEFNMCSSVRVGSTVDENVITEEATTVQVCGAGCWSSLSNEVDIRCFPF